MSFRQSISRLEKNFKKAKAKVSNIGHRLKGRGGSSGGEGSHRSALSLLPGPAIEVGGGLGGDVGIGVGTGDLQPGGSLTASHSAVEIGHDQGRSDEETSGGETDQKHLPPHLRAHVEGRSSQGGGGVDGERAGEVNPLAQSEPDTVKRTSPPPISQGGGSQST